eukprot:SAG22_NODE_11288_length_492_cov_0.888041_1_plen_42_part_10
MITAFKREDRCLTTLRFGTYGVVFPNFAATVLHCCLLSFSIP